MDGRAAAPGAGTILNALATGIGSAFAIDIETRATVELVPDAEAVTGQIAGEPDADTELIERCVQLVIDRFGDDEGGVVRTESDVPMAAGLKSSSAAANAAVLAACDALDVSVGADGPIDRLEACLLGVTAARDAGVTVTGAFDDASASMLGGITLTDNTTDTLRSRETVSWDVAVWTPPERAYSADADVDRCKRIAPMARLAEELASESRYTEAMSVNGLAFSAALGFQPDATVDVLDQAAGVSLSGTGPSVVAVGDAEAIAAVESVWGARDGTLIRTETRTHGARTL
ncbi:shikimate kinase [Halalkalirubrum salinum]|uniref:shikimate kinase n=1 Tax=Halalkalirubrum salinum TaxID=2563889 RepID=UPI0010FB0EF2|nr:shikimate kinase [Halalkalirubrum salinum]